MKEASREAPNAKPRKIRISVSLEPEELAILEQWEIRYNEFCQRDDFVRGAIRFMESRASDGLDANCEPLNPMDDKEAFYNYFIDRAREEGALPKELLPPQKPGRILRLVLPRPTEEKGA